MTKYDPSLDGLLPPDIAFVIITLYLFNKLSLSDISFLVIYDLPFSEYSTQSSFLLGKWIEDARSLGIDEASKNYYEENARTIVSTWGDKDQSLNDYANRTWGGLVSGYYAPRWEMFIDEVIRSVSNKQPFNADAFHQRVTQFEIDWVKSHERYPSEPVGNAVEIATLLMNKYKDSILKEKHNENN